MRSLNASHASAVVGLLVLLTLVFLRGAHAQEPADQLGKFRSGQEIVIPAGETLRDDLYAVGNRVRIDGRIEGDLFAAAEQVEVTGSVEGDVFAAGNQVTVAGPVSGDLRAAAGTLGIVGNVREDVLVGAGSLTIAPGAQIGQDLVFGSGETVLNGSVGGDVLGQTGSYTKQGAVAGRETVTVQERRPEAPTTLLDRVVGELRRYLGILLFGGLLLWLAPGAMRAAGTMVRERPLPSFGAGILAVLGFLVALVGLLLAAVVLAVVFGVLGFGGLAATSIVGALLADGVLSFGFALAVLFLANAVVGLAIGRLLLGRSTAAGAERVVPALLIGVLIVVLLTAIPVVGGLLNVVSVLLGLGALTLMVWHLLGARRHTPS